MKNQTKIAGGKARAASLSAERRSEIAKTAAAAKWSATKPLQMTHKGNFKEEFGIDVECYVLNDEQKTAVISQRGMGAAISLTSGGKAFTRFVAGKSIAPYLGAELREKIEKPLKFQWASGGAEQPPGEINGYDVTLLIDVCKAIVAAESAGKLLASQANIAKQAHVILSASAKAGIKGLVYALSGYDATKQEVIAAFKMYVLEEAKKYEKEFPPELYEQWHRLYNIPVPVRGRPWLFKQLTVSHVYYPLAKSNGKILELLKANKANGGDRSKKLFSFLNEIGARALRTQIGRLLEMTETSDSQADYERKIVSRFGGQQELELTISPSGSEPPSSQSPSAAQE